MAFALGRQKLREVGGVSMHVYADAIRACSAKPMDDEEGLEERRDIGEGGVVGLGAQGDGTAVAEQGSGAIETGDWTGSRDGSALQRALDLFDEVVSKARRTRLHEVFF